MFVPSTHEHVQNNLVDLSWLQEKFKCWNKVPYGELIEPAKTKVK